MSVERHHFGGVVIWLHPTNDSSQHRFLWNILDVHVVIEDKLLQLVWTMKLELY